ncbi:MAG: VOC family protein [Candidatus Eisenbacteria bacterium]|uniref:VOC family protein n=1 Tax=Eiseniibacteriota bacterium TaxID=2212470 RepID=A0A849SM78_UNCEI|nr:VOC family protein [Candidatus Eisenbacteria bacterium]
MQTQTRHAAGTFCWPELYTSDQNGAKKFYGALFGWEIRDIPMGPDANYTIFTKNGVEAAACYGAMPGMTEKGMPPFWMSYVATDNTDETAKKVKAAGGQVHKEPFDVPGTGRMAVLVDPTGASFCCWQAGPSIGIGVFGESSSLVWTELVTTDPEQAKKFYGSVFGWSSTLFPSPPGGPEYTIYAQPGHENGVGGMMKLPAEMAGVPSHWGIYYAVDDVDATVAKAVSLGGKVMHAALDMPGVGRMAWLADPAGANFAVMKPNPTG